MRVFGKERMWPGEGRGRFHAPFKRCIQLPLSGVFPSFTLFLFPHSSFPLYLSSLKPLRKGSEYRDRKIYLQIHNGDGRGDVEYSSQI